jgi:hypothetical protein
MELKIVDYAIADLLKMKNPKNPRWMPDVTREALQASLREFGVVEPVIVNTRTNQIVGGHQRVDAAAEVGEKIMPVVLIDVELAKETALNLLLNKARGSWDYDKLAQMLSGMEPEDLALTGFSDDEVESIVASFEPDTEILAEEGVYQDIYNRSEEETQQLFESTEKVQFGMFSKTVPTERYQRWVQGLMQEAADGQSPIALGLVVSRRLGIEVTSQAALAENSEEQDNELGD